MNILHSTRLRLSALQGADIPVMASWFVDGEVLRFLGARPAMPKTEADVRAWVTESHASVRDYMFGVRRVEDDALIGYVELDGILWAQQVSGLSILIGERALWGQGYGAAAARLALRFAFHELNLHRVQVTVFSYNARSHALFQKLGFQREGVFREFLQRDGQRHDMILYGLLRHEWEATI